MTNSADLVVTGPESFTAPLAYRLRCRTTLGVLTQLLAEANRRVIISAPFMQPGYGLSAGPISEAVGFAVKRGVTVDVISSSRSLQTVRPQFAYARKLFRSFRPRANVDDERLIGSHAKFCVADGAAGYIGSANLTNKGLAGQIEIGVLIRGDVAKQLEELCDYCIQEGIFIEE